MIFQGHVPAVIIFNILEHSIAYSKVDIVQHVLTPQMYPGSPGSRVSFHSAWFSHLPPLIPLCSFGVSQCGA